MGFFCWRLFDVLLTRKKLQVGGFVGVWSWPWAAGQNVVDVLFPNNHWTLQKRGVWLCMTQGSGMSRPPWTWDPTTLRVRCFFPPWICWLETVGVYKVAGIGIMYIFMVWLATGFLVSWEASKLSTWFCDVDFCCVYPCRSCTTNPTISEKSTLWVNCISVSDWKRDEQGFVPSLCQYPRGYRRECWSLFIQHLH